MAVKKKILGGTKGQAQTLTAASRRGTKRAANTIEQNLEDKAAAADTKIFAGRSLGQMSREERRKLLFG